MKALIYTEWLKMKKYNAFWWIIGVTALSYPGVNYITYFAYKEITEQPSQAGQLARMHWAIPFLFPKPGIPLPFSLPVLYSFLLW
jgi:hypothetical protein